MNSTEEHRQLASFAEFPLRVRQDISVTAIQRGLQTTYVVKDPVNLKYFEFDEHEIALIQQLEAGKSWNEICRWFNRRFPPLRLTSHSLKMMLRQLQRQGLVVSLSSGQGPRVTKIINQHARESWLQRLSQPWAIRLPGIDPGPWLAYGNALFGWLFSPLFVVLAVIGMAVLSPFVIAQFGEISKMPLGATPFFSHQNLLLFALVIGVTKMFHEFGHAIAACRHGCECHEMGILLLAGMPSLYCDVSDAWMLPSRWHRIAISLAGIWIELLVSALAFVAWMASAPGIVHSLCFNVMVVCSIGTILFNANPLVRYDGYYVLMDLVGIPNLNQRAHDLVGRFLSTWIFGMRDVRPLDEPELPTWCLAFGCVSAIYRIFLTGAIIWALHLALRPFSLSGIIWCVASITLAVGGIKMIWATVSQVRRAVATKTPRWRIALGICLAITGIVAAVSVPLPWYVMGEAILEPIDRHTLVATVPGQLVHHKNAGEKTDVGEMIARLENVDIEKEIQRLQSELSTQRERLDALKSQRFQDNQALKQIPQAEAALDAVNRRLSHLLDERQRLNVRAPEVAIVYEAPARLGSTAEGELPSWNGTVLDSINRDAWISAGEPVCQSGSINELEAIAIISQEDMESVSIGQTVDILLKSSGQSVRGVVGKISNLEIDPHENHSPNGQMPKVETPTGPKAVSGKWFQVQIPCLSPVSPGTMVRSRSLVRIHVGSRSIMKWIATEFFKTFRWHA